MKRRKFLEVIGLSTAATALPASMLAEPEYRGDFGMAQVKQEGGSFEYDPFGVSVPEKMRRILNDLTETEKTICRKLGLTYSEYVKAKIDLQIVSL